MSLKEIAEISREFGSDERYVLAGGGNTSFKDKESLYIKASGYALSTIEEDGFVRMERGKLQSIWTKEYPDDPADRESVALADLMASRAPGEGGKRPSVETLLHEAMAETFVVHTHPSLVNGLTCSKEGAKAAHRLFGESAVWIPAVDPGYVLATAVRNALQDYGASTGGSPDFIFLQNHGVFVASDTTGGIRSLYNRLFASIDGALAREPDTEEVLEAADAVRAFADHVEEAYSTSGSGSDGAVHTRFISNREILSVVADRSSFEPVSSAYTPDQIVYCGHRALYLDDGDAAARISEMVSEYHQSEGVLPKIVAMSGLGIIGCGMTQKAAENAALVFGDAVKIAVYAESFGGYQFMPQEQIDFIRNWEVEHYRSKIGS